MWCSRKWTSSCFLIKMFEMWRRQHIGCRLDLSLNSLLGEFIDQSISHCTHRTQWEIKLAFYAHFDLIAVYPIQLLSYSQSFQYWAAMHLFFKCLHHLSNTASLQLLQRHAAKPEDLSSTYCKFPQTCDFCTSCENKWPDTRRVPSHLSILSHHCTTSFSTELSCKVTFFTCAVYAVVSMCTFVWRSGW